MVKIERYGSNGEGIALSGGKVVFVPYALKGEEVEVEIIKDNKSFCVAKLKNVTKPSDMRTIPDCPYYEKCGGCQIMHACYNEQLKIKKNIVVNNLAKFAGYNEEVQDVFPSPLEKNYRNHMTFAVSPNGRLGLFIQGKRDVLEVKSCCLACDVINKCIDIFNTYFFDNSILGYNYQTKSGDVKQVDIKYINGQLLITVVVTKNDLPNLEHLAIRLNLLRVKYGVYISVNEAVNTVIYGKLKHLLGIKNIATNECGINSYLSPFSFVQVNNGVKEKVYGDILKEVRGGIVVDAYAGRGVLSAMVAQHCHKMYAIEISESSVQDGNDLIEENHVDNMQFICEDAQNGIDLIEEKIDTIILDPPRKGVDQKLLEKIILKGVNKIIYLSCASDTLARDIKFLMNNYKVKSVKPYDMFPNTSNVETLLIMEKKGEK